MQAVVNRGMAQSSHAACHANLPLPDAIRLSHGTRDAHKDTSCNGTLAWEGRRVG